MDASNTASKSSSKITGKFKQASSSSQASQQIRAASKVPSQPAPVDKSSLTDTETEDSQPARSSRRPSHRRQRPAAKAGFMECVPRIGLPAWLARMMGQQEDQTDDAAESAAPDGDAIELAKTNYLHRWMKGMWASWESCTLQEKIINAWSSFVMLWVASVISYWIYTGEWEEKYAQLEPKLSQISDLSYLVFGFLWTNPIAFQFLVFSALGIFVTLILYHKYRLIAKEFYQRLMYRGGLLGAVAFALTVFHVLANPEYTGNTLSNGISALANSSSPHVTTIIQYLPAETVVRNAAGAPSVSGSLATPPAGQSDIRSGMVMDATTTVTEDIAASPVQSYKPAKSAKAPPPKSVRELLALGPQHALKITRAAQPIEPVPSGIRTLGFEIYNLWVKLEKNAIADGTLRGPDSRAQLRSWIKLMRQTEQSSRSIVTKFQDSVDEFVGWWEEESDKVVKELRKIEATGDELSMWRKGQRGICLLAPGQCDDPLEVLRRGVLQKSTDRANRRVKGMADMAKVAHEAGHDLQTMVEKIVRIAKDLDHKQAKEHNMLVRGHPYYMALRDQEKWSVFKLKDVEEDGKDKVKDSVEALELSYAMFNQYKLQVAVIRRELAELSKVMELVGKALTNDRFGIRIGRDWNTIEIQENARKAVAALEG